MRKYLYTTLYVLCGVLLLTTALPAGAQIGAQHRYDDGMLSDRTKASKKKSPSIRHRPKMGNPADQVKYADALYKSGKLRKAGKEYLAVVHKWHESPESPEAQYSYASILEERGKYLKAFSEYQYLIDHFAGRFKYEKALDRQFRVANHVMTRRRFKFLFFPGFTSPTIALDFFQKIVANAPTWKDAPKAQFNIGLIEEQRGHYEDAAAAYGIVQNKYRNSDYAPGSFYRRAYCLYKAAKKVPRDEKQCRSALSALSSFLDYYKGDPNAESANKMLAELKNTLAKMYYDRAYFYDKMKTKPMAALISYENFVKNFPSSELTLSVKERIAELRQETAGMEIKENEKVQ